MNLDERVARLQSRHLAGRIIRNSWHKGEKTSDGYERACLLASFSPEVEEAKDAEACPADAMPKWLAYLTPYLDDNVSNEVWPSVVARYVAMLPKIVRLPAERLVRLDFETRAVAVREARSHMKSLSILASIDCVLALLDRAAVGQEVTEQEWRGARKLHNAGQEVTEGEWRRVVEGSAADAAWEAAFAAANVSWEGALAYDKAKAASWDRMVDAMLSSWERAVECPHVT